MKNMQNWSAENLKSQGLRLVYSLTIFKAGVQVGSIPKRQQSE